MNLHQVNSLVYVAQYWPLTAKRMDFPDSIPLNKDVKY